MAESTPPKRRPRFSLLNLFLLTAILAMGVVIRQLAPLREEVRRFRGEVGCLTVDDPSMIHVIQAPTTHTLQWTWTVHLPAERKYVLYVANGGSEADRQNAGRTLAISGGGEAVVRLRISGGCVFGEFQPSDRWRGRSGFPHPKTLPQRLLELNDDNAMAAERAGRLPMSADVFRALGTHGPQVQFAAHDEVPLLIGYPNKPSSELPA